MKLWLVRALLRSNLLRAIALVALALLIAQALPARAEQAGPLRAAAVSAGVWALVGPLGGPSRDNHALQDRFCFVAGVARHAREMAGAEAALADLGHAPAVNVNRAPD